VINDPLKSDPLPSNLVAAVSHLTHGAEAYGLFITGAYQLYLKRSPDAAGLQFWISQMQNGLTDEHLEASFLGSAEYIANHGGTGAGWVTGMYRDLLGRDPDSGGLAYWTGVLAGGANPANVAFGFAASGEREGQRVTADYQIFLGRSPDAGGLAYWVNQFLHGARNEDLVAGLVGSQEYYLNPTKGQGNRTTDGQSVYQDILHRDPTAAELAAWLAMLS
jgi:hypothetical protein